MLNVSMGTGTAPLSARYDRERLRKSFPGEVNTHDLTSTALLSYPETDLAGDVVVPEGISFLPHMSDPGVDVEHRRDPAFGDATVGTALDASGEYRGRHVVLKCGGKSRPLPVGTTHFDKSSKLQMQAFALVERDILPDVSLEFVPDWSCAKSLGKSPLEPRDAYEFGRVSVVRWTLCAKGVCPSATTLKSAGALPGLDPLRSVLSLRRVGGEELHPTIFKALSHYLPGKSNSVVSGYTPVGKAMDDQYDAAPEDAPVEDTAPAVNGISAIYAHVEALQAACDQLEQDAETSDSAEIVKDIGKLCESARALAEKAKGIGDKHDAKLQAAKGKGDEKEAEGDDAEPSDDPPDMSTEEDGTLKAVRPAYKPILKACRVRRYSLAEIQKAERAKSDAAAAVKAAEKARADAARRAEQDAEDEALVARARQYGVL